MEAFQESTGSGPPDGLIVLIRGTEAVDARVRQLFDGARSQIRAFDWPPPPRTASEQPDYADHRPYADHQPYANHQLREGVSYRILDSQDPNAAPNQQARIRPALPTKLLLADNHLALLPVTTADAPLESVYVIRAPAMLTALAALFEAEWERAVVLDNSSSAARQQEPDETSRTLLRLLAAGLTDTAITRESDWSPRTTQRRVKDLFDQLGVATRFQAGVVARDRGRL